MTPQDGEPTATPAPDTRFPAWLIDEAIASVVAAQLASGLVAAIVPLTLVRRLRKWAVSTFPGSRPNSSEIAAWLTSAERARPAIAPVVGRAFSNAYAQGWAAGVESAQMLLDLHHARLGPRDSGGFELPNGWGFTPGDADSARAALRQQRDSDRGARRLWNDGAPLMRKVVQGRIDEIADILADGIDTGQTPEAIAGQLRTLLDDRKWAHGVAITETSRAVNAATLAEYRQDRVPAKEWMSAFDQRVCPACKTNERAGPIGLNEAFPSGDTHPPAHPGGCRCGLIPAYGDRQKRR